MDAKTARTINIRRLVEAVGGAENFSRTYVSTTGKPWTAAQVRAWVNEKKPKPIGHVLARRIEAATNHEHGWMDVVSTAYAETPYLESGIRQPSPAPLKGHSMATIVAHEEHGTRSTERYDVSPEAFVRLLNDRLATMTPTEREALGSLLLNFTHDPNLNSAIAEAITAMLKKKDDSLPSIGINF